MLTPLQALLSALLTALIVQYLSIKYAVANEDQQLKIAVISRKIPKTLLLPTSSLGDEPPQPPPPEVNKLLDAIFVSHGIEDQIVKDNEKVDENIEETPPKKKEIIILDESNFSSVYNGDWLILAHVPWYPSAKDYLINFTTEMSSIPPSTALNLATLDCHSYPFLASVLNVRQYPSLHLVTQSGRLREWPFELKPLNQETLRFIVNGHWRHLPVYQLLKPFDDKRQLFLSYFQIKIFNSFSSSAMNLQPKIFDWIINNRPLTGGILGGLSLATLAITLKLKQQQ